MVGPFKLGLATGDFGTTIYIMATRDLGLGWLPAFDIPGTTMAIVLGIRMTTRPLNRLGQATKATPAAGPIEAKLGYIKAIKALLSRLGIWPASNAHTETLQKGLSRPTSMLEMAQPLRLNQATRIPTNPLQWT